MAGQAYCSPGSRIVDADVTTVMHRIGQHVLIAEKRKCQDR